MNKEEEYPFAWAKDISLSLDNWYEARIDNSDQNRHKNIAVGILYVALPLSENALLDLCHINLRWFVIDKMVLNVPLSSFDFNFRDPVGEKSIKEIAENGNKILTYQFHLPAGIYLSYGMVNMFIFNSSKDVKFQFGYKGNMRRPI